MSDPNPTTFTRPSERELHYVRTYNAPRELVFAVWTDPRHLAKWYGPEGFRTTTHEMDLRPGGVWRFTMHGPDGTDYHNCVNFEEVSKPGRLVYRQAGETAGEEPVSFVTTLTFEDLGGQTRLTMSMVFPTGAALDFVAEERGAIQGAFEHLERLARHLWQACEVVSARIFKASRERLFQAWSDPQTLARWWGPQGFTNTFHTFDLRPGGEWTFIMHGPDGANCDNHNVFREVEAARRIVVEHVSAPHFVLTVIFEPLAAGETRMTWHQRFDTAEFCERMKSLVVPANEQNFDRLEAVI